MPIEAGRQLLHYRLIEQIGEGGMGVVWKAHDGKLDREVAIKILPDAFSRDPERLARFEREAKLLASVNHPRVAAIYGFESVEDIHFLVLELVPGRGLDEMLRDGPLPVRDALDITRRVADGLIAAHTTGIVHRDLKPANVRITPDGKAKVLDFGLAKADVAPAPQTGTSLSPTATSAGTQLGTVLGTAAYMSPEQARGLALDKRTDVWSFGCMLFECLTAKRPFDGQTISDSIGKILEREPDWGQLPPATPERIRDLLRRCLEKDLDKRLPDLSDAVGEIDAALRDPAPPVKPRPRARRLWLAAPVVVLALLGAYLVATRRAPAPAPAAEAHKMMVVLPFDNMGPAEDEYFADGITEEISARLAAVEGIALIGRTTARQYKLAGTSVQRIGEELGIDYVLDGTVRWQRAADSSRVRVTPQLIRASDATQVWADVYEAEMSDIFEVQSGIAAQVARALDVALGESDRRSLESRPTENLQAYDFYLRATEYSRGYKEPDLRIAQQMYEKAIELDPGFALAHAKLAQVHDSMYWFFYDHSEQRLARAKAAIDRALELDPDLPEAHAALGWYYYHGFLDYERALEEFAIAEASLPDDYDVLTGIASVRRRQGQWEKSLVTFRRLLELDPLSKEVGMFLAETTHAMRRYDESERYFDRLIALAPDDRPPYIGKAWLQISWKGSTELAREVLDGALGRDDAADATYGSTLATRIRFRMFDGDPAAALELLSPETSGVFIDNQYRFVPTDSVRAQLHGLMGRTGPAREAWEAARATLEAMLAERPDDARLHGGLGIVYAGLGRKDDAIRTAKRGVELLPVGKEAWRGVYRVQDLARVYVMVGEYEPALDRLEYLLSVPGELTPHLLRLDPVWRPLQDHPRFRALVEGEGETPR